MSIINKTKAITVAPINCIKTQLQSKFDNNYINSQNFNFNWLSRLCL